MSAPALVGAGLAFLAFLALSARPPRPRIPRAPLPPAPLGPDDVPPLPSRGPLLVRAGDRYQMTIVAPRAMDPQALIETMERAGFTEIDVSAASTAARFVTWTGNARWGGEVSTLRVFFDGVTITQIANVGP